MNAPAAEHRQERREHARTEHVRHSATSASRSMPAEREPLSSTKSPGCSTRGSSSAAAATSAAAMPLAAVGGRRVRRAPVPDADHDVDAEARAGRSDLGVPARRVRPELGHVAEHGDRARAAGALDERGQRALHRGGIRVVGVVHEHAAAAPLALLPAQRRELDRRRARGQALERQAGADVGRGRGGEVGGVVRRRAAARPARCARRSTSSSARVPLLAAAPRRRQRTSPSGSPNVVVRTSARR